MKGNIARHILFMTILVGFLTGAVFPFFILWVLGDDHVTLSGELFLSTIMAGLFVGGVSFFLISRKIISLLEVLGAQLEKTEHVLEDGLTSVGVSRDKAESLQVELPDDPRLRRLVASYNQLTSALVDTYEMDERISGFSALVNAEHKIKPLANVTLDALERCIGIRCGVFLLVHDEHLEVAAHRCLVSPGKFIAMDCVQKLRNVQEVSWCKERFLNLWKDQFSPPAKSMLVCPVTNGEKKLLAILLLVAKPGNKQSQLRIMRQLSPLLANAVEKSLVYRQLHQVAVKDGLTGICNHRFGMERLRESLEQSISKGNPLGIILFDIDYFKRVNDSYGHLIGDVVLIHIANLVSAAIREGDFFFRYGGEEFMVILPGASAEEGRVFAERVRRLIKTSIAKHKGKLYPVTVSLGVASIPEAKVTTEKELIKKADEALYWAKDNGRDQVTVYHPSMSD